MALSFDKLKIIPNKSKLVVHGFIHQIEDLLSQDTIIPDLVLNLCILFYALIDRFDPECIGSEMELDEKTQCIVLTTKKSNSAFLTNIFESGLHSWKFQINKCLASRENLGFSQTIGIWKVEPENEDFKQAFQTYFTKFPTRHMDLPCPMVHCVTEIQVHQIEIQNMMFQSRKRILLK